MSTHICSHCNQPHEVKDAYKPMLNKHVLTMLRAAADLVIKTEVNDVKRDDVCQTKNDYTNFSRLRFFGLVFRIKDQHGNVIRGHWGITRNGWAFLRGELKLHKWVKIQDNKIIERATETIGVRDVYYGSDAIQTMFEYFDHDTGAMVGLRPTVPQKPPEQAKLLDVPETKPRREYM